MTLENIYYIGQTMEAQLFESEKRSLASACSFSGFRAWWASNTILFSDEFRAFIDAIVERAETAQSNASMIEQEQST